METRRILVAEDDRTLAETLVYNLKREGYEASIVRTGLEAVVATRSQKPDLILLDLMLPEMDGFEVCRVVRASSAVPIIMLTARDSEVDRVLGLELGADDYVVKPFSLRELLARVRANLRRVELSARADSPPESLRFGDLEVRPGPRAVLRGDRQIHLLPREFDLLIHLMRNRGIVLSRHQILEKVWGEDYLGETRTVDVHVRRLRAKLEEDPDRPRLIQTIHGVGYAFGTGEQA
ncbi:MAG: response regulator transcription factor [Chloroflexi bacterium]|nr:response regulator transcription factor [Chloroflexota bacterium]